jgi:hypothetical protein
MKLQHRRQTWPTSKWKSGSCSYPLSLAQWRLMLDAFEAENNRVPGGDELMNWLIDSSEFRVEMLGNIASHTGEKYDEDS